MDVLGADVSTPPQFVSHSIQMFDRSLVRTLIEQHIAGQDARLSTLEVDADRVHLRLERPMVLPLVPPGWRSSTVVVADADAWLRR
jgi:hypothetical protein